MYLGMGISIKMDKPLLICKGETERMQWNVQRLNAKIFEEFLSFASIFFFADVSHNVPLHMLLMLTLILYNAQLVT